MASGKGGVGKTSCALNLAYCLCKEGKKVCLIDADLGLANIDVILGIQPHLTLEDVIFRGKSIEEVLVSIYENLDILPGSSGIPALADLSHERRKRFIEGFSHLKGYDFIIIDNSPGIAPSVLSFCLSAPELIVVSTPEATSITDAYALIKSLKRNGLRYPPFFVLNRTLSREQIKKVVFRLNEVCKRFLELPLLFLGAIFEDRIFKKEMEIKAPLCAFAPDSTAGRCFRIITRRILDRPRKDIFYSSMDEFIEQSIIQFVSRVNVSGGAHMGLKRSLSHFIHRMSSHQVSEEEMRNTLAMLEDAAGKIRERLEHSLQRGTIAIYSEDPYMRTMLEDLLRDRDYQVEVIGEGTDLRRAHLIIFHHIPEKTNHYILERILGANIPILLISSFRELIGEKNVNALLASPFKIQDLYHQVEKLLQGRRGK